MICKFYTTHYDEDFEGEQTCIVIGIPADCMCNGNIKKCEHKKERQKNK